jgi:hypothetical protein
MQLVVHSDAQLFLTTFLSAITAALMILHILAAKQDKCIAVNNKRVEMDHIFNKVALSYLGG